MVYFFWVLNLIWLVVGNMWYFNNNVVYVGCFRMVLLFLLENKSCFSFVLVVGILLIL